MDRCTDRGFAFREGDVCKPACDGGRPHKRVSGERVCVDACSEYNARGACTSTCASGVYESRDGQRACIPEAECASGALRDGPVLECVASCAPTEYFVVSGDKVYCYDKCPPSHRFRSQDGRECLESCGGLPHVRAPEDVCVQRCSETGFPLTEDGVCVEACVSGKSEQDGTERLCVSCASFGAAPFSAAGVGCVSRCPDRIPFYRRDSLVCAKECSPEGFVVPGSFACEPVPGATGAPHSVLLAGIVHRYAYQRARSHAALAWSVRDRGSVAAFLEAEGALVCLRLRVAVQNEHARYAPVILFAARAVVASEFQLAARRAEGSALLALALLRNTYVVGSRVLASAEEAGALLVALWAGRHTVVAVGSTVEAGGKRVMDGISYV